MPNALSYLFFVFVNLVEADVFHIMVCIYNKIVSSNYRTMRACNFCIMYSVGHSLLLFFFLENNRRNNR